MTLVPRKATYFSSVVGGLITGIGLLFAKAFQLNVNSGFSRGINVWLLAWGIVFFIVPCLFYVFGIEFFREFFGPRFKSLKLKTFYFPNSIKDMQVIGRMLVWFFTTSVFIYLSVWWL